MADVITNLAVWFEELCLVLGKPIILFSLTVIGFPMLWLAIKQTELSIWLTRLDKNASSLLLFLLTPIVKIGFLWLNLLFLNQAIVNFKNSTAAQLDEVEPVDTQDGPIQPNPPVIRKNPDRSCKKKY